MKLSDLYPSKYLKATDITEPVLVTIRDCVMEALQDGSEKPVLYFHETASGLVCNRTNANQIAAILGTDDTEQWQEKQIILKSEKVSYLGQMVAGIRIGDPRPPKMGSLNMRPRGGVTPPKAAAPPADDVPTEWADEIPDPGEPLTAKMKKAG